MFDRFTTAARKVLGNARKEAENNDYLTTRHILIALVEAEGPCKDCFKMLAVKVEDLRKISCQYDFSSKKLSMGQIPFSQNAKKALENAVEIAVAEKSNHISPKHLLYGLCRVSGCSAQDVLVRMVSVDQCDKVIKILKAETQDVYGDGVESYQSPFTGEWK